MFYAKCAKIVYVDAEDALQSMHSRGGADMHDQLRRVLRRRRVEAELSMRSLEQTAGVSRDNLSRFETGYTRWPHDTERVVEAYAEALGLSPVDLWREALELYEREWVAPTKKRLRARVRAQEEL